MIALAGKPRIWRTPTRLWAVQVEWVGHDPFTMHFRSWVVAVNVALSYAGARP